MIYLKLFLTFLQVGAVSFGGGYAMISLIREKVLVHGWLSEAELLNMIAVSESTPGPIAVNMATFVGSAQGGILGSFFATLGVVLPSFVIILLIAAFIRNLLKYKGVQAFLKGIRPCIVGLILSTSMILLLNILLGFKNIKTGFSVDITGVFIFILLFALKVVTEKVSRRKVSPILMIIISAILGMILYSI